MPQIKNKMTIASILGVFAIITGLYAFHDWHKKNLEIFIENLQEPKFELINIKLDMLLTPEQIRSAHDRFKLIQETK